MSIHMTHTPDQPMHFTKQMEEFSIAYVHAIASSAGYALDYVRVDHDGIDVNIKSREGRRPQVEIQLKSTFRDILRATELKYPLDVATYNRLRTDCIVPRILLVVLVPKKSEDWLEHIEERLTMFQCGYWVSLAGSSETTNEDNITILVPRTQQFTVSALQQIMGKINLGENL
jgi:hypothetical protein